MNISRNIAHSLNGINVKKSTNFDRFDWVDAITRKTDLCPAGLEVKHACLEVNLALIRQMGELCKGSVPVFSSSMVACHCQFGAWNRDGHVGLTLFNQSYLDNCYRLAGQLHGKSNQSHMTTAPASGVNVKALNKNTARNTKYSTKIYQNMLIINKYSCDATCTMLN